MDGTSPGNLEIRTTLNVLGNCMCGSSGTHVYPCPWYTGPIPNINPGVACAPNPGWVGTAWVGVTQPQFRSLPLLDADIDRIARRVVELLKESK